MKILNFVFWDMKIPLPFPGYGNPLVLKYGNPLVFWDMEIPLFPFLGYGNPLVFSGYGNPLITQDMEILFVHDIDIIFGYRNPLAVLSNCL